MYYTTEKTSETGKKILAVMDKGNECNDAAMRIVAEYGGTTFRPSSWALYGGISSILFEDDSFPDIAVWKTVYGKHNEFMPRMNRKPGKEIMEKIKALPKVEFIDLNRCVGLDEMFGHIGVSFSGENIGIKVSESHIEKLNIPDDCLEITRTEYMNAFNK